MPRTLLFNHVLLFLCCSICVGTGVFLVLFQCGLGPAPESGIVAALFAGPAAHAATFFKAMTVLMLLTGLVMLLTEWFTGIRWVPIVVLAAVIAAAVLTKVCIFPYSQELAQGISDPDRLAFVLDEWAEHNCLRLALWAVAWAAMMYWFYRLAWLARADR